MIHRSSFSVLRPLSLALAASALALSVLAAPGGAQEATRPPGSLTLEQALALAEGRSEQIDLADAAVQRARSGQRRALAARLPQVTGTAGYTRTLESQFRGAFGGSTASCPKFVPDPGLPLEQRLDSLETAFACGPQPSDGGGIDFSQVGFGSVNAFNLGLGVSWELVGGGRLAAQARAADQARTQADLALEAAHAQLVLDVTQAFYDAQLGERMLQIAEASLEQAEAVLQQTTHEEQVGAQARFEVLRARVARDNQRPVVIRQRAARDVALFRVKQILGVPLEEPLALSGDLEQAAAQRAHPADVPATERGAVRQALAALDAQESQLQATSAQRLPSISLTSQYGRVAYPADLSPNWSQFRSNWTVGLALSVPLFTGGRIGADVSAAEAGVREARARYQQTRKQAALDSYQAEAALDAALAAWDASSGTVEQAEQAYDIAVLRREEGLSTQLEVTDARNLLQQARANRAQAARDLLVAQTRLRLIPDLPVGASGQGAPATSQGGSS
ncbi:MAG TPA: TolC family protein [Longimicrobiales bacterium]|nr:TolC family protein [Longimicrobiales bacterium]